MKNNEISNDLAQLISAVCTHDDCPEWLRLHIWDGFNDRIHRVSYSSHFFRHALNEAEPTGDCEFCCEPIVYGKSVLHNGCREAFGEQPEVTEESQADNLETLAKQIADIMHNPAMPVRLYEVIGDEISTIDDAHTPENVLFNLKKLNKTEVENAV